MQRRLSAPDRQPETGIRSGLDQQAHERGAAGEVTGPVGDQVQQAPQRTGIAGTDGTDQRRRPQVVFGNFYGDRRVGHRPIITAKPARKPARGHSTDTACMADLRAALAKDIPAVVAVDPLGGMTGRAGEIQALIAKQASLVAVHDGVVAGFLAVKPGHFFHRDFIDLLFVAPTAQRQGVGRALIRAALRGAATSRVFTSTNESNTPMRELLRSEGWTCSGVLTGLDEGDPEHVFFPDFPGRARPR